MSQPLDGIVGSRLTRRELVRAGVATAALLSTLRTPLLGRASADDQPPIAHRFITTNGIRMHIAEQGRGPLVILCHGFPESWYSWRHQLPAIASVGFHAVAPDMRGYGQTDRPSEIDQYTLLHLVGDMTGLVDALGADTAVIAGHDWGAAVAWHCALLRPDRFRAVIGLSVPFRARGPARPTTVMPQTETSVFYMLYFQTPGVAEAEYERNVRDSMRRILYSASGDAPRPQPGPSPAPAGMVPRQGGLLSLRINPTTLPAWLTDADLDFYTAEFSRTGFRGGLNWYRNIDRNWELLAAYAGALVNVPALYVAGDRDLVVAAGGGPEKVIANLRALVPKLRGTIILFGCGHWTQQERPNEVNAAIVDFLRAL